jgi:hypothetical protein
MMLQRLISFTFLTVCTAMSAQESSVRRHFPQALHPGRQRARTEPAGRFTRISSPADKTWYFHKTRLWRLGLARVERPFFGRELEERSFKP